MKSAILTFSMFQLLFSSFSKAEGGNHPLPWQTLDVKNYVCEVHTSKGLSTQLKIRTSLYQRKSNPKEKHISWNFEEQIGKNDINNLREEFISNLLKNNTELSIYPSKYLTGTRTELDLAGKDGQLKSSVIVDLVNQGLSLLPSMQSQIAVPLFC